MTAIGADLGVLADLATAIGLFRDGEPDPGWFGDPAARLTRVLADDTQRAALMSFLDTVLDDGTVETDRAGRTRLPFLRRCSTPMTGRSPRSRSCVGERMAQHVAAERVAERGHDHALVEREVGARAVAGADVDAVAEPPLAVQAGEVALEAAQVVDRLARCVAEGEEGGVRRHDAVGVGRRRRVGLRLAAGAPGEAVVDEGVVLVGRHAVGVHAGAVDAPGAVVALRLVRRREPPVAVAGLRHAVVDLRLDGERVVGAPAPRGPALPRARRARASAPRTCSRPRTARAACRCTGRRPRRRRRRSTGA